jgi:hypothetical protein
LAILLGSRNGFQNSSGRNLGSCMDWRFWQSLETASSSKTDADGKPMMHLPIRNNVTAVVM